MRIAIGANHRGVSARNMLVDMLRGGKNEIIDRGAFDSTPIDYPAVAADIAVRVSRGEAVKGISIGGMGFGMVVAANKSRGIRAILCHDEISAEISRSHCGTATCSASPQPDGPGDVAAYC